MVHNFQVSHHELVLTIVDLNVFWLLSSSYNLSTCSSSSPTKNVTIVNGLNKNDSNTETYSRCFLFDQSCCINVAETV